MHLSDCFCLMGCFRCNAFNGICNLPGRFVCGIGHVLQPVPGIRYALGYGHTVFYDVAKFFHGFIGISDHCTKFVLPVYHVTVNRTGEFPGRNVFEFSTDDIQYLYETSCDKISKEYHCYDKDNTLSDQYAYILPESLFDFFRICTCFNICIDIIRIASCRQHPVPRLKFLTVSNFRCLCFTIRFRKNKFVEPAAFFCCFHDFLYDHDTIIVF